jgi:glutaredoxin
MQVIVYSTSTCPYCKMLKDFLKEKNISFIEKIVDLDETAKDEMLASSGGFLGVPFTVIQKDDGSRENVIGFDKGKLEQILPINTNEHQ